MGFAAIHDQLACDDCLEFKKEFKAAKEAWLQINRICSLAQGIQQKYDAIRNYKAHVDGVKKDRALETHFMATSP